MWPLELVRMPACPPSGLGSCPSPRPCRQVIPCPWPQFHQEGPSRAGPGHRRQGGPVSWPPSASCRMSQQDRKQRVTGPPLPPAAGVGVGQGRPPPPPCPGLRKSILEPLGRPVTARWLPGRTALGVRV